ncbi:MAG TPA: hypothetical protein VIK11_10940 [Tepidiformaceae bacterium]
MSVEEFYEQVVRELSKADQLRLASYIVWKCPKAGPADYSSEWSDEDMRDFTTFSVALFDTREAIEAHAQGA